MNFPPVFYVVLSLGVFSIVWLLTSPLRRPRRLEVLLEKVKPDMADRLMPFIENQCYTSDQNLQSAIGGWRGVLEMHKQAGYIASIAHILASGSAHPVPELDQIVLSTIYLRFITPVCLVEMFFHELFNLISHSAIGNLRIPRVSPWGYARLYCDMVSSMTAVVADNDVALPYALSA
jgi:hypothetical protein